MSLEARSSVYLSEQDITQTIAASSTNIGCMVFASSKGPINQRVYITSAKQFVDVFGAPNPAVSYAHYCALIYLTQSNQLWCVRVAGTGYTYGALVFQKKSASVADLFNTTVTDPNLFDPTISINGSSTNENLALIYAIGPGSYASNISVEIISRNLGTLTGLTATPGSGGSLTSGSKQWTVTAYNETGETTGATVTATATASGTMALAWTAVSGATSYNIYGRTSGSQLFIANTTLTTYTDTGALTPTSQAVPSTYTGTQAFTLNVYDTSVNATIPQESYPGCTINVGLDGFGQQTEMSARINPFSSRIQVINYGQTYGITPFILSIAKTAESGGSSGAAILDSQINTGWSNYFSDPNVLSGVLTFINGGYASPAVQLNMDSIAQTRKDSFCILDLPTAYQATAQAAVNYRNNVLNLNSSYSALYGPDVLISDNYNGQTIYIPQSGYDASVYAFTDASTQPWFSPAGLNRGVVNILGLRYIYSPGDQNLLADARVNYIRKVQGLGYYIAEAYTLQGTLSALSFISIRRLLLVLEYSVRRYLNGFLWEPSDNFLRRQIVQGISDYLQVIQNQRGLSNTGGQAAYLVICDDSNNPVNLVSQGILTVSILCTPTYPVARELLTVIVSKSGQDLAGVAASLGQ